MNKKQIRSNRKRRKSAWKKVMISFLLFTLVSGFTGYSSGLLSAAHDVDTVNTEIDKKAMPETATLEKTEVPQRKYKTIEIQQGDTLWSIAETYMPEDCESVEAYIAELRKLNSLKSDELYSSRYLMVSCLK